jgi:hypothetical protein
MISLSNLEVMYYWFSLSLSLLLEVYFCSNNTFCHTVFKLKLMNHPRSSGCWVYSNKRCILIYLHITVRYNLILLGNFSFFWWIFAWHLKQIKKNKFNRQIPMDFDFGKASWKCISFMWTEPEETYFAYRKYSKSA